MSRISRPVCVVFAPFRGRSDKEAEDTDRAIKHLLNVGWCPVFLPYALATFLDDENLSERLTTLRCSEGFNRALVHQGEAFIVPGRISQGMEADINQWFAMTGEEPREVTFTDDDAPLEARL